MLAGGELLEAIVRDERLAATGGLAPVAHDARGALRRQDGLQWTVRSRARDYASHCSADAGLPADS